jgi:predicted transcriptional regulator
MPKLADTDRVLQLLSDNEGLSNLRIKTELNLGDERYAIVRNELIESGLVEKTRGRGGGIRLTRKGERESPSYDGLSSGVEGESDLYTPLVNFLEAQAVEDGVQAVVCSTHSLRSKGQWQNPDVTRLSVEYYRNLRKMQVTVSTYEVKQFPKWTVSAVYEAASHHRFSHEAHVVLEWPKDLEFSVTDPTYKADQIARECQRYGVGLATLHPHYNGYRLFPRIDATPRTPDDEDVDIWLDYVFSRNAEASTRYDERIQIVQKQLIEGFGR